jgi:hypothetical protein
MSFDWKGLLSTVAPGIATAFGGPLAGMAVAAVGKALNVPAPTEETIQAALAGATPEDMLKLKTAEEQFQKDMKSLDIDLERISAGDRDSARHMQIEVKSKVPAILGTIITIGFFGVLVGLLSGILTTVNSPELMILIGSLSTAWGMVVSFFYGSTTGSQNKDATIKAMVSK